MLQWDDLLEVTFEDGWADLRSAPSQRATSLIAAGRRIAVNIGKDLFVIARSEFVGAADVQRRGTYFRALAVDRGNDSGDLYRVCEVKIEPTAVLIRGSGLVDGRHVRSSIQIDRASRTIRLDVIRTDGGAPIHAAAIDWRILLKENRANIDWYVTPLFEELCGRHVFRMDAGDVYRIFPSIQPTSEEKRQFQDLIDALADADPMIRDRAEADLRRGGDAAVLVAMRQPPDTVSPEQHGRLVAFVRSRCILLEDQIAPARDDLRRMQECLDFNDRAVREAAKREIERLVRRAIEFDLDLEGAARTAAIARLKPSLQAPAVP